MREQRRMEESRVETVYIVRPNHLNAAGRLFGGMLVQWIDEAAGIDHNNICFVFIFGKVTAHFLEHSL